MTLPVKMARIFFLILGSVRWDSRNGTHKVSVYVSFYFQTALVHKYVLIILYTFDPAIPLPGNYPKVITIDKYKYLSSRCQILVCL